MAHRSARSRLKFLDLAAVWRENGPLGIGSKACQNARRFFGRATVLGDFFSSLDRWLHRFQAYLDGAFDRRYGTETSGVVPLGGLTIKSQSAEDCIWYEPMSVAIFTQIMDRLGIDFSEYQFIDFGSGKGRVLLLASRYGFKKIIGVEFAQELHEIAVRNVRLYEKHTGRATTIESRLEDATRFALPDGPLVIFFYSPFKGAIMNRVLANVSKSLAADPREMVIVFYGKNPESIGFLRALGLPFEELRLRVDFSRFNQYRSLVFGSRNVHLN